MTNKLKVGAARSCAISPDGEMIAVGLANGGFTVITAATFKVWGQHRDRGSVINDVRYLLLQVENRICTINFNTDGYNSIHCQAGPVIVTCAAVFKNTITTYNESIVHAVCLRCLKVVHAEILSMVYLVVMGNILQGTCLIRILFKVYSKHIDLKL